MKRQIRYRDMIGRTIDTVELVGDNLVLSMSNGDTLTLEPFGDCCSHTWIESIDLISPLIGGTIASVEDVEMPDHGNIGTLRHRDVDEVKYYGLRITTNKGISVIDYRNTSNGYYGGSLDVYLSEKESIL